MALVQETRKLLAAPDLPVGVTVAYVPLAHGHSASVYIETERPLSVTRARELLENAPGVEVEDDPGDSNTLRLFRPTARTRLSSAVYVPI